MKKIVLLMTILLTSCSGADISTSKFDNQSSTSLVESKKYTSISSLQMAKGMAFANVENYCEKHKTDSGWPRVRKYEKNNFNYGDEEYILMEDNSTSFCYKYYDGRNNSSGNLLYLKEIYIFPEIQKFSCRMKFNEYITSNVGVASSIQRTYISTFSFAINQPAKDVGFGGTLYAQSYSVSPNGQDNLSWANIAYLFNISQIELPTNLPNIDKVSFNYAIGDCSNPGSIKTNYVNENASKVYNRLQGIINFADSFLKVINKNQNIFA